MQGDQAQAGRGRGRYVEYADCYVNVLLLCRSVAVRVVGDGERDYGAQTRLYGWLGILVLRAAKVRLGAAFCVRQHP